MNPEALVKRLVAFVTCAAVLGGCAALSSSAPTLSRNGATPTMTTYTPTYEPPTPLAPTVARTPTTVKSAPASAPERRCHSSYTGACLDPDASDYDCAGGSGNGPYYTGRVEVVGPDDYDLDRDGDGIGCE